MLKELCCWRVAMNLQERHSYNFVRSVSALHYHAIPVLLNREDPDFICIPTLGVKFPGTSASQSNLRAGSRS